MAVLSPLQSPCFVSGCSWMVILCVFAPPVLQCQVQAVQGKLENVRSLFEGRQSCFRRLLDKHVRPVQLVAPRPENPPRAKSPLFSPKHGNISWDCGAFS